ncbi:MAG TPA: hypothetical protein VGB42_01945 [Candidatus Thermoplasmatota archaeon]
MSPLRPRADPWAQDPSVLYVRPSVSVLGADFGRRELGQIALASAALVAIFACGLSRGVAAPGFLLGVIVRLPVALVACVPTFFVSIYLQKRVGSAHGCTVEFQVIPQWLGISVFFSVLLGFVFAIPGSVQRFGNLSRIAAGRMAIASPGTFLAVATPAAAAAFFYGFAPADYAFFFLITLIQITSLLAVFQMLPFAGFPGLDIWRWSKVAYSATLAVTVALVIISQVPGFLFA